MVARPAAARHRRRRVGPDRAGRSAARAAAQCGDARRVRPAAAAARELPAAGAGLRPSRLPQAAGRLHARRRRVPAHRRLRPGARSRRRVVADRQPHAGALRARLRAAEPDDRLAAVPGGLPRAARAAARRQLPPPARHALSRQPRRRRRQPARGAAHSRALQRDLLRARLPGPLPRHSAGRGRRSDGARRPRVPQDAARAGARARHPAPARRRLLRSARAAQRLRARRAGPAAGSASRRGDDCQRSGIGLPRVAGDRRVPAGDLAAVVWREADSAVAGFLVVRRSRRSCAGTAAAGQAGRQADLRHPGIGAALGQRGGGAARRAATAETGGARPRPAGRAHAAGVPADLGAGHLARRQPATAHGDAACIRGGRRRRAMARAAGRADPHCGRGAGRHDGARRLQRRHLGADPRNSRDVLDAAGPAFRGRAGVGAAAGDQPGRREPVLDGPLHRAGGVRCALGTRHARPAWRGRRCAAAAARYGGPAGGAAGTGARRRSAAVEASGGVRTNVDRLPVRRGRRPQRSLQRRFAGARRRARP